VAESDKVMFEIYRESGYGRRYRAVYFTELDEDNKEAEISRAMAGEHVYDSFLSAARLDEGKQAVTDLLARLNNGESPDQIDVAALLQPYEA